MTGIKFVNHRCTSTTSIPSNSSLSRESVPTNGIGQPTTVKVCVGTVTDGFDTVHFRKMDLIRYILERNHCPYLR